MKWESGRRSENVEDRRGMRRAATIGGGMGILGLILMFLLSGGDFGKFFAMMRQQQAAVPQAGMGGGAEVAQNPEEEKLADFVKVVLGYTEDVWQKVLPEQRGIQYPPPTLVLFTGQTQSACGFASAAVGPFYCPADQKLYIDLSFYQDLKDKFGADGDFAQAYVVAHEVGHHIQNLLGYTDEVHRMQGRLSKEDYNRLSVRLELQADFLAGVWARHAQAEYDILEQGDIKEAIDAALAIGDDRLQAQTQGYVVPEAFTHGTSEQRARWFRKGLESGDVREGDTFNIPESQL